MGREMRFVPIIVSALAALAVAGCGSSSGETSAETGGGGNAKTISLSATEYSFDPGTIQIDEPGTYTFALTNDGGTGHALEIEGQGIEEEIEELSPGDSGQLTVTFSKTGSYEFYCPVDGHRDQGMEGTLAVGAASGGAGTMEDDQGGDDDGGGTGTEDKSGGYGYG
jgi:plastocyanin